MVRTVVGVVALVTLLSGCSATAGPVEEPTAAPGRTTWTMRHGVRESAGLRITGQRIDRESESTTLRVGEDDCYVTISANGGPDNQVGKKIRTTVGGRPAVRSGAGAEGSYLMWQLDDGSWVETSCSDPADAAGVDRVAAALVMRSTSIRVPFRVRGLPGGLAVTLISTDLANGSADVYLSGASGDLQISLLRPDWAPAPTGRSVEVNGQPAVEDDTNPDVGLYVSAQHRLLLVGTSAGDTGPYPDRTGDLPLLRDLAHGVTLAATVADTSTWFAADEVFG